MTTRTARARPHRAIDPSRTFDAVAWLHASAVFGGAAWLALLPVPMAAGVMNEIAHLIALALLVIVPLGLALLAPRACPPLDLGNHALPAPASDRRRGGDPRLYRLAGALQPVAAALATASFFLPTGPAAALAAMPWLMFAGLAALFGLTRLRARRDWRPAELCLGVAPLLLPIGAGWLVLARGGADAGFGPVIANLTVIHFHYTGFAAAILAGLGGRLIWEIRPRLRPAVHVVALAIVLGLPLIALGITLSPPVEILGVVLQTSGLVILGLLQVFLIAPVLPPRLAKVLVVLSGAALLTAMLLALAYGWGEILGANLIPIPRMVAIHGRLNALGFALCGLVGWTVVRRDARAGDPDERLGVDGPSG